MPSTINADNGVVSGSSGVKTTADTSGELALQSNGVTGLTLNTSLALGVGSGNSTGSSGQVLTSAGAGAPPTWQAVASASYRSILNQSSAITLLPSDGGGYLLVSSTLVVNLNLPDATLLTSRNFIIKNVGSFTMLVRDATGTYLFPLSPQQSAEIWTSSIATSAGQWVIQDAPPPFIASTAALGTASTGITSGNYVFGKISDTQQVFTYTQARTIAGQRPYALVITQSSGTLSYGTPYELANELADSVNVAMLSSTSGIANWFSGGVWRGCAFSVSGSVITPGPAITIGTEAVYGLNKAVALSSTTAVAAYSSTIDLIRACVLTVSGNTLSAGSLSSVNAGSGAGYSYDFFLGGLTSSQAVCSWESNSGIQISTRTLNVSGTTITYGTTLNNNITGPVTGVYGCVMAANLAAITYNDSGTQRLRAISVSGTTCTLGTGVVVQGAETFTAAVGAMSETSGIVAYTTGTSTPRYKGFTRSGTTFTLGSEVAGSSVLTGNYAYQGLQGFSAPTVGVPATATFMSSNFLSSGANIQNLSLSGTTVSAGSFTYPVPAFFIFDQTSNPKVVCALSATRAISIVGSYAANGALLLSAFLIDFSTPTPTLLQTIDIGAASAFASIDAISPTQAIVVYRSATLTQVANVITMSGSTISVGAQATISSATTTGRNAVCRLTATTAIAIYRLSSTNASANVLTVSGTSISVGSPTQISNGDMSAPQVQALTATSALAVFQASGARACLLSISGTSITAGSPVNLPNVSETSYYLVALNSTTCALGSGAGTANANSVANLITVSGSTITISNPTNIRNTPLGIRMAFTSPTQGVALGLAGGGFVSSFYVDNGVFYFSEQLPSFGISNISLQAPATASPAATNIALLSFDGYSIGANQVYSLGAIS